MAFNNQNPSKKQSLAPRQAAEAAFNQSLEQLRDLIEQRQQELEGTEEDHSPQLTETTATDWESVADDLEGFFDGEEEELP